MAWMVICPRACDSGIAQRRRQPSCSVWRCALAWERRRCDSACRPEWLHRSLTDSTEGGAFLYLFSLFRFAVDFGGVSVVADSS